MDRMACGPNRVPGRCDVPPSKGAPIDHDVGAGEGRRVAEVAAVHAEERDVRAEHRAVPGHRAAPREVGRWVPSRVEAEADGVQGAQPRPAAALAGVGLGHRPAGELDTGPAHRLGRERQRLACAPSPARCARSARRPAGPASPGRRTGWRPRRARCSRRRRRPGRPFAVPQNAENREQVSMMPPQAWVNRSPSSCGEGLEEVLGQPQERLRVAVQPVVGAPAVVVDRVVAAPEDPPVVGHPVVVEQVAGVGRRRAGRPSRRPRAAPRSAARSSARSRRPARRTTTAGAAAAGRRWSPAPPGAPSAARTASGAPCRRRRTRAPARGCSRGSAPRGCRQAARSPQASRAGSTIATPSRSSTPPR